MKMKKLIVQKGANSGISQTIIVIVLVIMLVISFPAWYMHYHVASTEHITSATLSTPCPQALSGVTPVTFKPRVTVDDPELHEHATCPPGDEWCTIPMPKKSFFGFNAPDDPEKWRQAQILAAQGGHVLLRRVLASFPHPNDFLDGDISFRQLHRAMDVFIDKKDWFEKLATPPTGRDKEKLEAERREAKDSPALKFGYTDPGKAPEWSLKKYTYVPDNYDFVSAKRAPIAMLGYSVFERDRNKFFSGTEIGGLYMGRQHVLSRWNFAADRLKEPIILVAGLNENWGMLSGMYPNRTAKWGAVNEKLQKEIYKFIDHPNLLMLVVNQHLNFSHPKILNIPRGLPLTWSNTHKIIWDTMRIVSGAEHVPSPDTHQGEHLAVSPAHMGGKDKLLFAASSTYGYRPQILQCISERFRVEDFEGHVRTPPSAKFKSRVDRSHYYAKLATARFGLSLPGLGYDCYRTWEILTVGAILVVERGFGMDRTFWRLPVLLLKDFAELTPDMLKQAYVEAMYRRDDFEFDRLHYSYWIQLLTDVSVAKDVGPMVRRHPMAAEDPTFTRPLRAYTCGAHGELCGKGTKRPPEQTC